MGQINLHAILDFSGLVLRCYTNSRGRLNTQRISLALKWIEKSELFDNTNISPRQTAIYSKN